MQIIALCLGASIGAMIRWYFNSTFPVVSGTIPLATLSANWIGAYIIGLAWAYFNSTDYFSAAVQLFVITGLLGALTTFSTFSLEAVQLLLLNKWLPALTLICLHVFGSILLTFLGIKTYYLLAMTP